MVSAHCVQQSPPRFPTGLQYRVSSKRDDIDFEGQFEISRSRGSLRSDKDGDAATPSTVADARTIQEAMTTPAPTSGLHMDNATASTGEATRIASVTSKTLSTPNLDLCSSQFTQASADLRLESIFRGMMNPEQATQGDTQTQSLVLRKQTMSQQPPSESIVSTSGYTASPTKPCVATAPPARAKVRLNANKAGELKRNSGRVKSQTRKLAKYQGRKTRDGDIVYCQCNCKEEEGEMVACTVCDTWQHLHCYGYTGAEDPRLPDEHTCYQCLLGDAEPEVLVTLRQLAVRRRGMQYALQYGLTTLQEFADGLGLKGETAEPTFKYLKGQKYVLPASGSHRAGYVKSGKPLFVAANHDRMLADLFDPLTHISQHVSSPQALHIPCTTTHTFVDADVLNAVPIGVPHVVAVHLAHPTLARSAGRRYASSSNASITAAQTQYRQPSVWSRPTSIDDSIQDAQSSSFQAIDGRFRDTSVEAAAVGANAVPY